MCTCPKQCSRREALNAREKHAEDYGPSLTSVPSVGMVVLVNPLRLGWLRTMTENVCLKKKDHDLPIYTLPHANCHIAFMYTVNILGILGNTVNKNVSSRSHTMHINSE